MRITRIEPQKRKRKRYSIWIDNQYSFSCDKEVLLKLCLEEGQEVSFSELEALLRDIQQKEAKDYSLYILARRPLSEAQLKDKLRSRRYDSKIISIVIDYLKGIGLIDDLNYSRLWIRSRSRTNPRGALLLRQELRMKGIASQIIERVLDEFKESYNEEELLVQVAEKRAKKLKNLDPISRKRRLFNYLLRRGFLVDEVRKVIKRY